MKKSLYVVTLAIMAALVWSCGQQTPVNKLYADASKLASQPATWASRQPQLDSSADSASYLMGYIYGCGLENVIAQGKLPELDNIDPNQFEKGFAMAMAADSTQKSLLYGIMLGLELRNNMNSVSRDIDLQWNSSLAYKGFYQGLHRSVTTAMPAPMAEEQLNRLLQPYFMPQ